jgi:hypothetical protein
MKPIFELGKFSDGRLMLRVRFYKNSNFWINDQEEATWVPTLEEVDFLKEVLGVANEHNEAKQRMLKPNRVPRV